jgi:uncharacterized protein (UPF0335 family)
MRKAKTADDGFAGEQPVRAASAKIVLSLIRRVNETKTRVQSENGMIGQEIKDAVEDKHLNARALKSIARLTRMDADKRLAELAAFDLYRTYAEEAGLFGGGHVGDLVDDAEAPRAEALGDVVANNVRKLKGGIKATAAE